jgi:hypothetical protein
MERNESIAQEALKYLDNAQMLEENGKLEEAIESYLSAADFLKKSGYALTRIDDIYERVQELKGFINKEKSIRQAQLSAELEQLQERAFSLLDAANKFEIKGQFNEAILQYNSAISLLVNAGWSDIQLANLREKVNSLSLKTVKLQQQSSQEIEKTKSEMSQAQVVGAFGKKKDAVKAEELRKFTEARAREEQIQKDAFTFIDNAKFYEQDRKYGKAIESYRSAIDLLNSIGWHSQTSQLESIVTKLEIERRNFESFEESKKLRSGGMEYIEDSAKEKEKKFQKSVQRIEEQKLNEEKIQSDAFNLIDEGKNKEKEQKYDEALEKFNQAIDLFNSIGWDSYIQPVRNLIRDIEEKIVQEDKFRTLKEKREDELKKVQDAIYLKEQDEVHKVTKEMEEKRKLLEEKRNEELQKEKEFLELIEKADEILKNEDFDSSITKYREALNLIGDLGAGWDSYKNTINATINNIKILKEKQLAKEIETQKKLEEQSRRDMDFQRQMNELLNRERARLRKEEVTIQAKEDLFKQREQNKKVAFETLESAQNYIKSGDLDNAILSYQKVANIFAEIQWTDEIPVIENSIKELQKKKEERRKLKKEEMERSINKLKEEQEFQVQIFKQLKLERKKIKEKEFSIKLKEKQKAYQEQQKKEVFTILGQAQSLVVQNDFDNAINKYNEVVKVMAEMHWHDEIALIQNSILEIERKKRDSQLQKEKDLRQKIAREQDEQEFQDLIIKQMRLQQESLKQKQIVIREREKELAHREKMKGKAFELLNSAQDLVAITKFDEAIDLYREVAKIFAQIQWKEEIPLIQQSIQEIERKKVEKEEWKQKTMQDAIKRENAYKQFIDQIKHQREIEQVKVQKELELLEEKKLLDEQSIKKRDNALKLIEEADESIQQENYNLAISNYENAIKILEEIGWTGGYLNLLQETLETISVRKKEKLAEKQKREQILNEKQKSEEAFQKKLRATMEIEQKRLRSKVIEVQKKGEVKIHVANQKEKAFKLLEDAESLLNQRKYEDSIKLYREAEIILTEIEFPADIIREMIRKIEVQRKEEELAKIKESEKILLEEKGAAELQEKIQKVMQEETIKLRDKQIKLEEQENRKKLLEERKQEAFEMLNRAEEEVNKKAYEQALTLYREAELILSEIRFPTDLIKDTIRKLQIKKNEDDFLKQQQLERQIEKQKEETIFQNRISDGIRREKKRLREKAMILEKKEEMSKVHESLQNEAFKLLDLAQEMSATADLEGAINNYKKVVSIFEDIGWNDEIPLLKESIQVLIMKQNQLQTSSQRLLEQNLKIEKENSEFNRIIAEQSQLERERLLRQQIELKEREDELKFREIRKSEAFNKIDEANELVELGKFEDAKRVYLEVENIFAEIQWIDEIDMIHESIIEIEKRKWDNIVRKQKELQEELYYEKLIQDFQNQIALQTQVEQEKIRDREITLRERKAELELREKERIKAFELLDKANNLIALKNYEEAINVYRDTSLKFARIGWTDEISLINQAISDAERKKEEAELLKQKEIEEASRKERERLMFIQSIKKEREREKEKLEQQREKAESLRRLKEVGSKKQEMAFKKIENADDLIKQEEFDEAIQLYTQARDNLNEIGWTGSYISLLNESIQFAKQKMSEAELRKEKEREIIRKQVEEQKIFEEKLKIQLAEEQERLQKKQFEIQKREALSKLLEERKEEAFKIMTQAESLLVQGLYEESLKKYNDAELILSEINFPTDAVREMVQKIRSKIQERFINEQRDLELKKQKEEEEKKFHKKILEENLRKEEQLRKKEVHFKEQEELRDYIEKRKTEAFNLLDNAEGLVKESAYDKALEYYNSAEVILNEIQFPTNTIHEMRKKVADMQNKHQTAVYNDLQTKLQKAREEKEFKQKLAEEALKEKQRLENKKIEIREKVYKQAEIEKKKERAFKLLDDAKPLIEKEEFDEAIELYRKAIFILNEVQFPTGSLDDMIRKIMLKKKEKEEMEELEYQRKVDTFKRDKQMEVMIQERKRQEREQAMARAEALKERDRLVQEQINIREAAYSLLGDAGKHLKQQVPDYDMAISLYIQARNILSEKIGWEPEINNINMLIKDLEKEKTSYLDRKQFEKELELKRQKEYEIFQAEIRKRKEEYKKQKIQQEQKLRDLYLSRKRAEMIKEEGLALIDKGKEHAINHDFEQAYNAFHDAIRKFTQIGWTEQTKYIDKEIENARVMEQQVKEEQLKLQKVHEDLLRKKQQEDKLSKKKEKELKSTVSDVSGLTGEIAHVIKVKKLDIEKQEGERRRRIKQDAKDYRKSMSEMIKLKQELIDEIKKADDMVKKEQEKYKLQKDKEKADEIKKMLKDISKSKKK